MTKKQRNLVAIITITIGSMVVLGLALFYIIVPPYAIAGTANQIATIDGIFTRKKLIKTKGTIGSSELAGVFQLSSQDIASLQSSNPFIKCPDTEKCHITNTVHNHTYQCYFATISGKEDSYELCIDIPKNRADWSIRFR